MPTKDHEARCIWPAEAELGEGPLWSDDDAALYWVDILGSAIFRYTPATERREICRMPFSMTALAPTTRGELLCTSYHDIYRFAPKSGALSLLRHVIDDDAIRINDGGCHPDGSFWFGTMDNHEEKSVGDFYRLAPDGACERFDVSFVITNGPAFSPDGEIGYFVDTVSRNILRTRIRQPFELEPFARIPDDEGHPDGIAVDADGGVWCAHFGGARVTRFDADAHVTDVIRLPVSNVTKCAFGGEPHDRLFITTARKGLDAAALASQKFAGGVFVADVGYRGVAASKYRDDAPRTPTVRTCNFEAT